MSLAIFDLDNTLISGDSDYLWGIFLTERGIVDAAEYARKNQRFYADYEAGILDIYAYQAFMLQPLVARPLVELYAWREQFIAEKIQPLLLPKAQALVDEHRAAGDTLLIITATNRFLTAPLATQFGIPHLIATEPEMLEGGYSGRTVGIPSFQHGKVERLRLWLKEQDMELGTSWFYSDSHNDLPLLNLVTHPVAVDPDPKLSAHAQAQGWPIISLR